MKRILLGRAKPYSSSFALLTRTHGLRGISNMRRISFGSFATLPAIVLATCLAGVATVAQAAAPVKLVPICVDDICFPVQVTGDYFVKVADFNGDAKLDLYITGHPTRRYVTDFLLYQNNPASYTINAAPSQAEKALAQGAPISPVTVSRMELNADRFYDFYLRNVEEVIANASDIIITLARGTGGTPTHVIPVTEQFLSRVEGFTGIVSGAKAWVAAVDRVVCGPNNFYLGLPTGWGNILMPGRSYTPHPPPWIPYFVPVDGPFGTLTGSLGGFTVTFSTGSPGNPCFPGYKWIVGPYASVINDFAQSTNAGGEEIWSREWCNAVFSIKGGVCEDRYALVSPATVAPAVIVSAAVILAVLYYTDQISADELQDIIDAIKSAGDDGWIGPIPVPTNATPSNRADVGPGTAAAAASGDKYAFQNNCNRGPSNTPSNRGVLTPGSSSDLRKNLDGVGCGCPNGSDAHHILPKGGGGSFPQDLRDRIRNCLNNAGLDVDHPTNGVCLPQRKDPNSKAVVHGSANGRAYWNDLAVRCENALSDGGPQAVRDMLNQARQHLLNGNPWWKPGAAPF